MCSIGVSQGPVACSLQRVPRWRWLHGVREGGVRVLRITGGKVTDSGGVRTHALADCGLNAAP